MVMTYAALAKSLGISLKSSTSSASATATHASSVPANTSTPTDKPISSPGNVPKEESKSSPSSQLNTGARQEHVDEEKRVTDEMASERCPSSLTDTDTKGAGDTEEMSVVDECPSDTVKNSESGAITEEEGANAGAEGAADSDIASSRPSSPNLASAPARSPGENISQTTEAKLTESTIVPQSSGSDGVAELRAEGILKASSVYRSAPREPMSDEQLHQAKVLVLDLLGWGVPPEYLLQRGVSHALLYTVFTDLRLRLPDAIFEDCVKLVSAQL